MEGSARARIEKRAAKSAKVVSLATFFSKYAHAEDGFKYEYNNGLLEKHFRKITKKHWFIVDNIERRFAITNAYQQGDALMKEPEIWTSETQVRAPDFAYLTKKQIRKESSKEKTMSTFLIEVVSETDMMYRVIAKMREYFKAGAEIVRLILPESEEVYVYTAPTLVQICTGNTKCYAGSNLLDFDITAAEIFQK